MAMYKLISVKEARERFPGAVEAVEWMDRGNAGSEHSTFFLDGDELICGNIVDGFFDRWFKDSMAWGECDKTDSEWSERHQAYMPFRALGPD